MATRALIRSLQSGPFSLDVALPGGQRLKASLPPRVLVDVSDQASPEQISQSLELAALRDDGILDLVFERDAEASDIGAAVLLAVLMDSPDQPDAGDDDLSVGFQVIDQSGASVLKSSVLEFAVFDDEDFTIPSVNAVLQTATEGTIVAGEGTAALKIRTSGDGKFTCTLTDSQDETVYLACMSTFGGPLIDCQDFDSVTFST